MLVKLEVILIISMEKIMATKKTSTKKETETVKKDYRDDFKKILPSLEEALVSLEQAEASFEEKRRAVEARDMEIAERASSLKKRANELKDKEAEFEKKSQEVKEAVKRIATVKEAKETMAAADIKMGQAQEIQQKGEDALAEAKKREEQVLEREKALNKERGEYKARVRQEIINKFLKQ